MEDREWTLIAGVLEECWPGEWTERTGPAYRLLLDTYSPEAVVTALRKIALRPATFKRRPSAQDILSTLEEDPDRPTFEMMLEGLGRVLRARPVKRVFYAEEEEDRLVSAEEMKRRAVREASGLAAGKEHPLVASFILTRLDRLALLQLEDPDYGELRRKELREEWDRFVGAREGRERHLLAGGRRGELGRLEPLKAIGAVRPELEAGEHG